MKKLNNKGFAISTVIYGTLILFVVLMTILIYTLQFRYRNLSNGNLVSNGGTKVKNGEPNAPDLSTGLVPIKYDEEKSKWVVTSESDTDWYDYDNQKWANAASLKSTVSKDPETELDIENDAYAMFVWIPRYSYTIGCKDQTANINLTSSQCLGYKIDDASDLSTSTPGAIDIKFVDTNTKEKYDGYEGNVSGKSPTYNYDSDDNRKPSNWYTHPAFTFGSEELSGIWVGKFETSTDKNSDCYKKYGDTREKITNCNNVNQIPYILPNVKSLRYQTISNQFNTAKLFTAADNSYGLSGDAHVMKNSEWGAVAYLSQSIYGKYGNPNYEGANKEIYINNSRYMYTGRSYGATNTSNVSTSAVTYKYDGKPISSSGTQDVLAGTGASTTGNIYGIYDMNGGSPEHVMGNYNNKAESSGFGTASNPWPDIMYFDVYNSSYKGTLLFETKDQVTNGGALAETWNWYGDESKPYFGTQSTTNWLARGCGYSCSSVAGVFYCGYYGGGSNIYNSFRVSLVRLNNL